VAYLIGSLLALTGHRFVGLTTAGSSSAPPLLPASSSASTTPLSPPRSWALRRYPAR